MGIDEKAILKGHKYMTVITDLETGEVVDVFETRTKEAVLAYFNSIPMKYRKTIKSISMDMWSAYFEAAIESIPDAENKIVFDKFHISQYLNKGVDKVRIEEHAKLSAEQNETLKGTKFHWLYNFKNIPKRIEDDFKALRKLNLKTGLAWSIKETFRNIYNYNYKGWAKNFFDKWFDWTKTSELNPMIKVAEMLKRHLPNIITYCDHNITNGKAEAANAKIMSLKRKARGHRNFENLRTLILFYYGQNRFNPRE
jgi:transposase